MRIADERALRVRQIRDDAVVRIGARERRVPIAREARHQQVIIELQQPQVSPVAGVELLRVKQQHVLIARRVGRALKRRSAESALPC